jgi:carbon-monoxide dehydrogenase small subunit
MATQDALQPLQLKINGEDYQLNVPANRTLVDVLRHDIGLTGTKETCSVGVCGACTILIDGEMIASCITLAVTAFNTEITTIEGLDKDGPLHPLQESFINNGGFQCGACTSGQILAAKALLDQNPEPSEIEIKEWMMGNLCRCTGYYQIIESIVNAVASEKRQDNANA